MRLFVPVVVRLQVIILFPVFIGLLDGIDGSGRQLVNQTRCRQGDRKL